jgi:NADPH:quinone reductase-like Zn-dependent oxidoreductase
MRAIVQRRYGSPDVLELVDVDMPIPEDNEVLVRIQAASVNRGDWVLLTGRPAPVRLMGYGLREPNRRIPGMDFAGRVEAIGGGVTRFRPGDEVFGSLEGTRRGAFAEYLAAPEDAMALKPTHLTPEQAAAVSVSATAALQGLRDAGRIQAGQSVLINGAAGGVGTFAVQIAKAFGAAVTGVCSTRNVDMVRAIGADQVIDYTRENFTESERRYDLLLDIVGNHPLSALRRVLTPRGTLVLVSGGTDRWLGPFGRILQALAVSPFVSQRLALLNAKHVQSDLLVLRELLEAGRIRPVITRRFRLAEVPEALRQIGAGHSAGKVVITLDRDSGF